MIITAQNSIADLRPIHCSRVVGEVLNEIKFLSINHNLFIESDAISEVDNLVYIIMQNLIADHYIVQLY